MENLPEFEMINPVPKDIHESLTKENGKVTLDLTGYDPITPKDFPGIWSIHGINDLRLFSNYVQEIPNEFCGLQQLRTLFMSCSPIKPDNGLLRLPELFGNFSQLEELHLLGNHFEAFPLPICRLCKVEKLYMDNCTLTKIPQEIQNLSSLVVVDFSYNSLGNTGSFPDEFFNLPNLKDLYLIDCQLMELPPAVGNLKSLEGLRLGKNNLSKLPEELYNLTNLRKLSAERNQISELSPRLGQLCNLKLLLIMENTLVTLPDEIKNLESCKHINVFDNKLTCIPRSIIEMPVLDSLIVDGNSNLRRPPIDVCKRGLSSIRGYFESLEAVDTQAVHSQRLKVMLLGEAGAGKSSLAYALVNATALTFPDGQAHSTVGVDFYTWRPVPNGIEFHIADFAGQRRYQLTHPFFLSSEALHILVVDLFNYDSTKSCFCRTIGDWLDLVTSRVLKPRVMIVPTHLDEFETSDECLVKSRCDDIINRVMHYCKGQSALIDREILEKKKKGLKNAVQGGSDPEWKKNNPPVISSGLSKGPDQLSDNESYIAMVPVSSIGELTGMKELQDEIIRVANDSQLFPSVGRDLPEDWITLEKALKNLRVKNQVRCMSFNEFESFTKEHTSLSPLGTRSALSYLDSIGELRYYKSIPSDYDVFIDLKWLAKLVKCLFRHDLEATLKFDEVYFKYNVIGGNFENLKTKLLKEALLSESLLRCLWHEMNLDDDMFPQMVELLHHLGLACPMPPDGSDERSLLVPWFLREFPEAVDAMPDTLPEDQDEIHLLFMMAYLPPGLFNRLRVRCCSPHCDHYNWKDHVILLMNEHRVLIWNDKHPPGTESNSPAIHIRGRTPKGCREILWEVLLHLVQETEALLAEWQRLNVKRFSLCPPCTQKRKPSPCLFPCNWMSTNSASKGLLSLQTKICKGGSMFLRGEKFDINLIYPPPDVVKRVLDAPSHCEPVSEDVPQALIADVSLQITRQWTIVASYLGIPNDQVDALDADNDSVADKIIAMLNAWKRQETNKATRSNLVKALEKANRNDVAEKVRLFKEQ